MEPITQTTYDDLTGKVAFITGGAGRIGLSTALAFARSGVAVGLSDIKEEPLAEAVRKVEAAGGRAIACPADVTDAAQMEAAVARTVEAFGPIDIVFANAGNNCKWIKVDEIPPTEWERTLRVNLLGAFHAIGPSVASMKSRGRGGSIIVTSSINGTTFFANKGSSAYCAAKAGLVAMTRALAVELADFKIRINAICPGSIASTEHLQELIAKRKEAELNHDPKANISHRRGQIPLTDNLPGTSDEIADLVCFLASNASRHMTGASLTIDGAQSLAI